MAFLASLTPAEKAAKAYDWTGFLARDEQLPPQGNWSYWLLNAGRGFGKTRTGAETVRQWIKDGFNYVNLVGATSDDIVSVMIDGPSGIMAVCPNDERPRLNGQKRRLEWPNGARSRYFSAEEPRRLRGPNHEKLWCDEIAAWQYPEAWDQAVFGLRTGNRPQAVITTTPRPLPIIRMLIKDPQTHITRGSTYDNKDNLSDSFVKTLITRFEGTRLGRQELEAEMLDDVPGALWTRSMIDAARVAAAPQMVRIVVAVDPSGTSGEGEKADDVGIVVAGKGVDGLYYVLADRTCNLSPSGWGRRVAEAFHEFKADRVIVEKNFGGDMALQVIRSCDATLPIRAVNASRGKVARAEPIAALFEQGRVKHMPGLTLLEDQFCGFTPSGYVGGGSPDRADAAIWALTELSTKTAAPVSFGSYGQ